MVGLIGAFCSVAAVLVWTGSRRISKDHVLSSGAAVAASIVLTGLTAVAGAATAKLVAWAFS